MKLFNTAIVCAFVAACAYYFVVAIGGSGTPPAFITLRAQPTNTQAMVFLHGWRGSQETWRVLAELAVDDPELRNVDIHVITYPTHLSTASLNVAELTAWIVNQSADKFDGKRTVFIAHSLGGVIARKALLLDHLAREKPLASAIITIASPHGGADPARLGAALGISPLLLSDLAMNSTFIRALQQDWAAYIRSAAPKVLFYCLGSVADRVVSLTSAYSMCDPTSPPPYPEWGHTDVVIPDNIHDPRYKTPIALAIRAMQQK